VKLLSGQYTAQYTTTLHDLVRLALVTGARIDELCALEAQEAHHREDGWWVMPKPEQAYEPEVPVKVREWISSALASPDLVLEAAGSERHRRAKCDSRHVLSLYRPDWS
jgi:integrase